MRVEKDSDLRIALPVEERAGLSQSKAKRKTFQIREAVWENGEPEPRLKENNQRSSRKHRTEERERRPRPLSAPQVVGLEPRVSRNPSCICPNNPVIKNLCLAKTTLNKVKKTNEKSMCNSCQIQKTHFHNM